MTKSKQLNDHMPETRLTYTFDLSLKDQVKRLARILTTPRKPVTMSSLIEEAIIDLLAKYSHIDGVDSKRKPKPLRAAG